MGILQSFRENRYSTSPVDRSKLFFDDRIDILNIALLINDIHPIRYGIHDTHQAIILRLSLFLRLPEFRNVYQKPFQSDNLPEIYYRMG